MFAMKELVQKLSARLPELAWKLKSLHPTLNPKLLPPGLFSEQLEMTVESCIDEINANLQTLNGQDNERSAQYLADQVHKKINVLVRICQVSVDKRPNKSSLGFGVQAIATRQQWLGTLEEDIAKLSTQQQALAGTLHKLEIEKNSEALLKIKAEIGELEARLTLAKEALARAISA